MFFFSFLRKGKKCTKCSICVVYSRYLDELLGIIWGWKNADTAKIRNITKNNLLSLYRGRNLLELTLERIGELLTNYETIWLLLYVHTRWKDGWRKLAFKLNSSHNRNDFLASKNFLSSSRVVFRSVLHNPGMFQHLNNNNKFLIMLQLQSKEKNHTAFEIRKYLFKSSSTNMLLTVERP